MKELFLYEVEGGGAKQSLPPGIWQMTLAQGGIFDVSARKSRRNYV